MYKLIGTLIGGGVVLAGSWALLDKGVDAPTDTAVAAAIETTQGMGTSGDQVIVNSNSDWPDSVVKPLAVQTAEEAVTVAAVQDPQDENQWVRPDERLDVALASYNAETSDEGSAVQDAALQDEPTGIVLQNDEPPQYEASAIALQNHELPQDELPQDKLVTPVDENHYWQVIWGPFNSEASAEGFVKRLSQVTGLLFSAIEQNPGRYVVAVAYDDDTDRIASLATISAKTGLNLAGLTQ